MHTTRAVTRGSVRGHPITHPFDPATVAVSAPPSADVPEAFEFLSLHGDLDAWQAPALRQAFAALPAGQAVTVDMSGVDFIDSAGLGALIGGIRRVHACGGTVTFTHASNPVRRLFAMTGLDRIAAITA